MADRAFSKIHLGNFRAFADPVEVPLGKITLLYGQNSAGKSSIIRSLLLMQQSVRERRNERNGQFVFTGDSVDLGSFAATVFEHDLHRSIKLGIDFPIPPSRNSQRLSAGRGVRSGGITWDIASDKDVKSASVTLDGQAFTFTQAFVNGRQVFVLDKDCIRAWCELIASGENLFASNDPVISDLELGAGFRPAFSGRLFPTFFQGCAMAGRDSDLVAGSSLNLKTYGNTEADQDETGWSRRRAETLADTWEATVRPIFFHLRDCMKSMSYLGPLRREPQRLEHYSPTSSERNVGASGEDMLSVMNDRPSLVTDVNNFLSMMELPYRISVKRLDNLNHAGSYLYLTLSDVRSGVELSPTDVGVGYSQVLPLITQSVLSRNSLVCIEQPELHLHPAMQSRLADVFIRQALSGNNVQFLIETHSENLMLRLLRRIREGEIAAEEVQVLYVDQDTDGRSHIVELPILPSGDFAVAWPHGFFDERLEEFGL